MSRQFFGRMARILRRPLFVLFLFSGFFLGAQTPSVPAPKKSEPSAPKQAESAPPAADEKASSPILLFRVRSAFSLTPAMLHVLQTKSADQGAGSGSGSAPKSAAPSTDSSKDIAWGETLARSLPFAAPLDVRLVGKNVVALVQIVPIELRASVVDLIVQGQVWVKMPDNSLSFKTTVQSLSLPLGSKLYFYPLGADAKSGAPIAVEIRVDRQSEP